MLLHLKIVLRAVRVRLIIALTLSLKKKERKQLEENDIVVTDMKSLRADTEVGNLIS